MTDDTWHANRHTMKTTRGDSRWESSRSAAATKGIIISIITIHVQVWTHYHHQQHSINATVTHAHWEELLRLGSGPILHSMRFNGATCLLRIICLDRDSAPSLSFINYLNDSWSAARHKLLVGVWLLVARPIVGINRIFRGTSHSVCVGEQLNVREKTFEWCKVFETKVRKLFVISFQWKF